MPAVVGLALCSCSTGPSDEDIAREVLDSEPRMEYLGETHRGPGVVEGETGTARFASKLLAAFDVDRAMETVRFADGYYRAPGNEGYDAVLDRVSGILHEAGYGTSEGFEIEEFSSPLTARGPQDGQRIPAPAWNPRSARLAMQPAGGAEVVLHSFDQSAGADRCMLPINAPSADVTAAIAFTLDELQSGQMLVTDAAPRLSVLMRAQAAGASAVVSSYLSPTYNVDPTGAERHLDAIQFRSLAAGTSIPVAMISPRSMTAIREAHGKDPQLRLSFQAEASFTDRPLRTLCARIVGTDRATEAVVIGSHVQEPGACDNASGVAGLAESARTLIGLIGSGEIPRPSRTLVFLWGDEFRQTEVWFDETQLTAVAGLSSDMTGESSETGAIALLERMPDPGAHRPLLPDPHTPWGETPVGEEEFRPNGLAIVARCAMLDVAALEPGWQTADHPYEGGSDHDVFIERGIPAALFWHFTDFTYHTSLDRVEYVDPGELRRTGTALMATALALADPVPADLQRYLLSLNEELNVRVQAAREVDDEDLERMWKDWSFGARQWLRIECLRIPAQEE
jgi:hypothetical protein